MKKFIAIFAIIAAAFVVAPQAKAQSFGNKLISANTHALIPTLDTITNTGLKTMTVPLRVTGAKQQVTISTVNTVLTGTLAGIARLWASNDGVNYVRVRSTALVGGAVDSLIVDANHKVYHWTLIGNPANYYQVQTTGVGTVTFTVKGVEVDH